MEDIALLIQLMMDLVGISSTHQKLIDGIEIADVVSEGEKKRTRDVSASKSCITVHFSL